MTMRRSLIVGACLFIGAWILPALVGLGVINILGPGADGWGFLGVLALATIVVLWLQGMMLGASLLLPLATYLHSLRTSLSIRRVMTIGLILWALPAMFVPRALTAAARAVYLKRYTQADCRAGVRIDHLENDVTPAGVQMVLGLGYNTSPLVLAHLKISLDGDPPRATPLECWPLHRGGRPGYETEVGPGGPINFGCEVSQPSEPISNVRATILETTCDGARGAGLVRSWMGQDRPKPLDRWASREETEAYLPHVKVSATIVETKDDRYEVRGTLTNDGDRAVQTIEAMVMAVDDDARDIAGVRKDLLWGVPNGLDAGASREFTAELLFFPRFTRDPRYGALKPRPPVTVRVDVSAVSIEKLPPAR
jgi:hypothetical protein